MRGRMVFMSVCRRGIGYIRTVHPAGILGTQLRQLLVTGIESSRFLQEHVTGGLEIENLAIQCITLAGKRNEFVLILGLDVIQSHSKGPTKLSCRYFTIGMNRGAFGS
jgi:hypothetical protein